MVRAKTKISYRDAEDEEEKKDDSDAKDASDESDAEYFSDAPPAKKQKKIPAAKKKVKKVKKPKKSKYTDDSDEDEVEEVSEDETAPATWRPGGPVVMEAKKTPAAAESPKSPESPKSTPASVAKKSSETVYKDASDHDFTDDGEIEDAADSDFDATPKKKTPAKKTPVKKTPVKKKSATKKTLSAAKKKSNISKKAKDTNGHTPRSSGRAGAKSSKSYADTDEEDDDSEDDAPLTKRKQKKASSDDDDDDSVEEISSPKKQKVAKQAKGRDAYAPKKEVQVPPVSEMVQTAIKGLGVNPRKGSSLAAIKGYMGEEWGINIKDYAPKIKKYILRGVENEELIQTKGKGASGRFTVPGLKARKKKGKAKRLGKKFDEDVEEYKPVKGARDEAREKSEMELAERRAKLEEEAARKLAEKEMQPKVYKPKKTDWVVEMIKGMKLLEDKTWYQVKWEGSAKLTWEPEENLVGCQEAIDNFLVEEKTRLKMEEERRKREEEEGAYDVQRILEVKFKKDGSKEFLIRWKGHKPDDDSWEPEENLECADIIAKFMEKHEKIVEANEKTLRIAPKKVQRLTFDTNSRSGIRKRGGFRKTYEDMDYDSE